MNFRVSPQTFLVSLSKEFLLYRNIKRSRLVDTRGMLNLLLRPKQKKRWFHHLCVEVETILALSELLHLLIPGYTATIDK